MGRAGKRADRLIEMERLYCQRAYTDIEMADRLGVDRTTVYRDRQELELRNPFIEVEEGRYRIDLVRFITDIKVNRAEALSLYLAARRASQQTRYAQSSTASGLEKLALALQQPMTERLVRAADRILRQQADPQRGGVYETVARAWIEGLTMRLDYRAFSGERARTHRFDVYLLEPSPWSDGVYLIGYSDLAHRVITLKLDRVEKAILSSPFTVRPEFNEEAMLKHAWGIWGSDRTPDTVRLRFAPGPATRRLRESIWHPLEQVTPNADGGCTWEAPIAEWQEMLPWIRGWGADVEVLGPVELREELIRTVQQMTRTYQIVARSPLDPLLARALRCWGKTGKTDVEFHPAIFHMIDVANVAAILLSQAAPVRFRRVLSQALDTTEQELAQWIPWLIGLHDIGKITVSFQSQNAVQKGRLQQEGFSFAGWPVSSDKQHSIFSQIFVEDLLPQLALPTRALSRAVAEMIGGHHGVYQSKDIIKAARTDLALYEPEDWPLLRNAAEKALREQFLLTDLSNLPSPRNVSAATMALSGFTILCDWVGSDSRYFVTQSQTSLEAYVLDSKKRAQQALRASGLLSHSVSQAPLSFAAFFPDVPHPRPLQLAIDEIPESILQRPSLTIIEAPTGEGKTEAALALAHRIANVSQGEEFFYALPTMATSNQMFGRLQTHLHSRLNMDALIKLVHGQSFLVEDELRIDPLSNGEAETQSSSKTASIQWFNGRKRALLAPFGVGTIDQAELAALNTRHAALRMFGLAGKVVIVDEVHAYDTYMTTIIEQMLRWLAALNTSVILLSATLPLSRRAQLAEAYGLNLNGESVVNDAYPSLLILGQAGIHQVSPEAWQTGRRVTLNALFLSDEEVEKKARWLLEQIRDGGCACWITNTVKRAQQLYEKVQELAPKYVDVALLHSQYPLEERQRWETELTGKYGPKGMRPSHGIVIGTQVLEQSLDNDFDIMVSDLAPIDLLLQRMGRLHRHQRIRPVMHQTPRFWINLHQNELPMIPPKADRAIYTEYLLRQTWEVLAGLSEINLPTDYRPLIQAVYDAPEPAIDSPLRVAWEKLAKQEEDATQQARIRLLGEPNSATPFSYFRQNTFEEDENSAAWIVAQTRLGEESLNIIPLEVQDGDCILPDGMRVPLHMEASTDTQLKLLRRGLRISHPGAIQAVRAVNQMRSPLFRDSPLLKQHFLLPLTNGAAVIAQGNTSITFVLHPRLGLTIDREKS